MTDAAAPSSTIVSLAHACAQFDRDGHLDLAAMTSRLIDRACARYGVMRPQVDGPQGWSDNPARR